PQVEKNWWRLERSRSRRICISYSISTCYVNDARPKVPKNRRGSEELLWRFHFVWFYLEASANQTNRTRQNETRRKDESRRIQMNRTLQDESRRIKMNRTLQDESNESTHSAGHCGRFGGRFWPKRAKTRTNPREFALNALTHWEASFVTPD